MLKRVYGRQSLQRLPPMVTFFYLFILFFVVGNPPQRILPLIFRESGRVGGRERNMDTRETHRLIASRTQPNLGWGAKPTTQVHALGLESNLQPFGALTSTLTTEPHWAGLVTFLITQAFVLLRPGFQTPCVPAGRLLKRFEYQFHHWKNGEIICTF